MSKRARVSRSDSFDQLDYPNKISSTNNSNKFLKPSSGLSDNVTAAAAATIGDFPKACFFCKENFKKENHIYMYRSLAFCTEECREVQISFDENMMKTRLEAANKKGYN